MSQYTCMGINPKMNNRGRVFELVYETGKISKPEIAAQLKISLPTAIQCVKSLEDDGLLREDGLLDSTGGRKAAAIACNEDACYAVGVDITRNHLSVVLIDLYGKIRLQERAQVAFEDTAEYYQQVGKTVLDLIGHSALVREKILGIGLSVPGILSQDEQILLYSHVLQIKNERFSELARQTGLPVMLCNDANAAGIAEMFGEKNATSAVYLSLSNSVGGSIIFDHRLYCGEGKRAAEFGHMTLHPQGKPCYCGKLGCVDAYCSANVLAEQTQGRLPDFFEQVSKQETLKQILEQYLQDLSLVVHNLRMAFDCDVILGGYVGGYLEEYLPQIHAMALQHNPFAEDGDFIRVCRYRREAAAVGAALLQVKGFLNRI